MLPLNFWTDLNFELSYEGQVLPVIIDKLFNQTYVIMPKVVCPVFFCAGNCMSEFMGLITGTYEAKVCVYFRLVTTPCPEKTAPLNMSK